MASLETYLDCGYRLNEDKTCHVLSDKLPTSTTFKYENTIEYFFNGGCDILYTMQSFERREEPKHE